LEHRVANDEPRGAGGPQPPAEAIWNQSLVECNRLATGHVEPTSSWVWIAINIVAVVDR
jgi:hypothetical protein